MVLQKLTFRFLIVLNKIWNDWFRCEYLQDSVTVDLGDGPDSISNYVVEAW